CGHGTRLESDDDRIVRRQRRVGWWTAEEEQGLETCASQRGGAVGRPRVVVGDDAEGAARHAGPSVARRRTAAVSGPVMTGTSSSAASASAAGLSEYCA